MADGYLVLKFVHVATAIVALGTSAGLGILLELYGRHPRHGLFVLRAVRRLEWAVVVPGYLLMPATGLWMVEDSWSLATPWVRVALGLWGAGLVLVVAFLAVLARQIRACEQGGAGAGSRWSLGGRLAGGAFGLAILLLVYDMVAKPAGFLGWGP